MESPCILKRLDGGLELVGVEDKTPWSKLSADLKIEVSRLKKTQQYVNVVSTKTGYAIGELIAGAAPGFNGLRMTDRDGKSMA